MPAGVPKTWVYMTEIGVVCNGFVCQWRADCKDSVACITVLRTRDSDVTNIGSLLIEDIIVTNAMSEVNIVIRV
jgi:hypothetical protein